MAIVSEINSSICPTRIVFRGGNLYNPRTNAFERKDLAIERGKIKEVKKDVTPRCHDHVVSLSENDFISPGWIDLHTHFWGYWGRGMEPDKHGLEKGVVTQVDAGSAGINEFERFLKYEIRNAKGKLLAFLNIAPQGLSQKHEENYRVTFHDPQETADMAEAYRDTVCGIKVRIGDLQTKHSTEIEVLKMAKKAAKLAGGLRTMVHIMEGAPLKDICGMLEEGDIITHAFRKDGDCTILTSNNRLKPYVIKALKRGVRLDLGHGAGGFHMPNAKAAVAAMELLEADSYKPITISTDLHCDSVNGPVFDLSTTIAKMISLGMTREDAIASVTKNPAETLGLPTTRWRMHVGDTANLTVWRHEVQDEETYPFVDTHRIKWKGKEMLKPKMVFVNSALISLE